MSAETILTYILVAVGEKLIEGAIDYVIKVVEDAAGNAVTQIVHQIDRDGDGIIDEEVVLHTLEFVFPDLSDGYCIVNSGDKIGLGVPEIEIIDGLNVNQYFGMYTEWSGVRVGSNGSGYIVDYDGDGNNDEVLIPLSDINGDGVGEYGWLTDDDDNRIPDASGDAPFYEIGTKEFQSLASSSQQEPSIIVMAPDGTMTVYDRNGEITAEDCDTAYTLWVAENGIMDKQLDDYSVTEGLLLLLLLMGLVYFVKSIFKKKDIYRG